MAWGCQERSRTWSSRPSTPCADLTTTRNAVTSDMRRHERVSLRLMTTRLPARCTAGDIRELEGQPIQHPDGTGAQACSTGTAPLRTRSTHHGQLVEHVVARARGGSSREKTSRCALGAGGHRRRRLQGRRTSGTTAPCASLPGLRATCRLSATHPRTACNGGRKTSWRCYPPEYRRHSPG